MAIVAFEIEFTKDASNDYRRLPAHVRAAVQDALEVHLRHEPTKGVLGIVTKGSSHDWLTDNSVADDD